MVIDIVFQDRSNTLGLRGATRKVVEVLNAYPPGTSARAGTCELLRAVASAQRFHQLRRESAETRLREALESADSLEARLVEARVQAADSRREMFARFSLLLRAKVDKGVALEAEAAETAAPVINPLPAPGSAALPPSELLSGGHGDGPRKGRVRVRSSVPGDEETRPKAKRRAKANVSAAAHPATEPVVTPAATTAVRPPPLPTATPLASMSIFDPDSSADEGPGRAPVRSDAGAPPFTHAPRAAPITSQLGGVGQENRSIDEGEKTLAPVIATPSTFAGGGSQLGSLAQGRSSTDGPGGSTLPGAGGEPPYRSAMQRLMAAPPASFVGGLFDSDGE